VLALRGTGQIKSLSILTVLPRIFYLVLLAIIVFIDRFSLTWSLDMFFMGFGLSLIWCTIIIQPSFKSMRQSVVRLWHDLKLYGIHLYLSNIWNELLFHGDKFIISLFLPAQSLAYYYLAYALTFPLSHFSTALSTTMFNRFALQRRIDSRVLRVNMLFVLSSVGVFIVLRRFIIINLFSPDYLPTVAVMLPLALAFGFSSVSKPFTLFLVARGEGKVVRNISIVIPILNIILGLIIIPHFGIMGAAWTQVLVYCCDLLLYFLAYRKFIANLSA
jgi:O-antigen/teichoic acid export membrane protein